MNYSAYSQGFQPQDLITFQRPHLLHSHKMRRVQRIQRVQRVTIAAPFLLATEEAALGSPQKTTHKLLTFHCLSLLFFRIF